MAGSRCCRAIQQRKEFLLIMGDGLWFDSWAGGLLDNNHVTCHQIAEREYWMHRDVFVCKPKRPLVLGRIFVGAGAPIDVSITACWGAGLDRLSKPSIGPTGISNTLNVMLWVFTEE